MLEVYIIVMCNCNYYLLIIRNMVAIHVRDMFFYLCAYREMCIVINIFKLILLVELFVELYNKMTIICDETEHLQLFSSPLRME